MNKINIVISGSDNIEGYNNITVDDLLKITNGTCNEIICSILDYYPYDERISLLANLCKKLSNLGLLTIKFIDASKICKDVIKGNCSSQFLSSLVNKYKSFFLEHDITELVSQIDSMRIYKTYNDNINSIIVLQKNI